MYLTVPVPRETLRRMTSDTDISQIWISSPQAARVMYTDEAGQDYDVADMVAALRSIRANTAPNAISLSGENRIKAIYQIAGAALPTVATV